MDDVKDLLFRHFTNWQIAQGKIKSVKQFSEFVGVDYKTLDHLFNNRSGLSQSVADKLAKALNDLEFYDLANVPRPDPLTFYIERSLPGLNDEGKRKVANEIARHTTEPPPE